MHKINITPISASLYTLEDDHDFMNLATELIPWNQLSPTYESGVWFLSDDIWQDLVAVYCCD